MKRIDVSDQWLQNYTHGSAVFACKCEAGRHTKPFFLSALIVQQQFSGYFAKHKELGRSVKSAIGGSRRDAFGGFLTQMHRGDGS